MCCNSSEEQTKHLPINPFCMKHFKVQKERCQAPQRGDLSFQSSLTQYAAESLLIVEQENEM